MTTTATPHRLCADCFAGRIPQRGAWPDNGDPRCCGCGRPDQNNQLVFVPIFHCGACAERAAAEAEIAAELDETGEPELAEAGETSDETEPQPPAA